jgi:hypothetical protein
MLPTPRQTYLQTVLPLLESEWCPLSSDFNNVEPRTLVAALLPSLSQFLKPWGSAWGPWSLSVSVPEALGFSLGALVPVGQGCSLVCGKRTRTSGNETSGWGQLNQMPET